MNFLSISCFRLFTRFCASTPGSLLESYKRNRRGERTAFE